MNKKAKEEMRWEEEMEQGRERHVEVIVDKQCSAIQYRRADYTVEDLII